jgi:hypothetical protein
VLLDHLTVYEKYLQHHGTTLGASESSRQPVIPPAPLTGDVGCDRGDAGRTLLFLILLLNPAMAIQARPSDGFVELRSARHDTLDRLGRRSGARHEFRFLDVVWGSHCIGRMLHARMLGAR